MEKLHIIEPTLHDQTGHCYSFIRSLKKANERLHLPIRLWLGREAKGLFVEDADFQARYHFTKGLRRRLQELLLYRRLLRQPGIIYISTGTRTDLFLLDLAAGGRPIPPHKVFIYVHWLRLSARKRRFMARIANRHPHLTVLAPSAAIAQLLKDCGFRRVRIAPYPITPVARSTQSATDAGGQFRQLLFAGAARRDKGFEHVVELVAHLAANGQTIPIAVQISPPHNGRHEPAVAKALQRLRCLDYPSLKMLPNTLSGDAYYQLFPSSITLQLYDPHEFAADRVSGVALDALSYGSPLITSAGTWMAKMAERFQAGIVVHDLTPQTIAAVVLEMLADFPVWQSRARHAGEVLQQENDGANILRLISSETV